MIDLQDPDRAFALTHAPKVTQDALAALWALDERIGSIVTTTTQPMIGQMRMTWWHEALSTLQPGPQRGEPVLDALGKHVIGTVDGVSLARLVEGWEVLLDDMPLGTEALERYANARGAALFAACSQVLGGTSDDAAGRGWALADLALRCSDAATVERARELAERALAAVHFNELSRPLRILARLASADVRQGRRVPRTFWRLIGAIR